MSLSVASLIFNVFLGLALLLLPGMALLQICLPRKTLGWTCRLTLAPGITIALCVLVFTWADIFSVKLGPLTSWLLVLSALLILLFLPRDGRPSPVHKAASLMRGDGGRRKHIIYQSLRRFRRDEWLAAVGLTGMLTVLLVVRFSVIWGWCVPPGFDTAQHTLIVQLLLDHHGLFRSWAPYNDAQTFTYHFGFHAITALFAWLSGLDAASSVLVMTRLLGAAAAAVLFALVRLWTRSPWGGASAALFWLLYSRNLYNFDGDGRWPLLTGLVVLGSALVLLSLYLRADAKPQFSLGVLSGVTVAGLVLSQYKTAIIFAALAAALFCSRCAVGKAGHSRLRGILQITSRALAVVLLALLLAGPRIYSVMEAKPGRYLKRVVLEAPALNSNPFDRPTLKGMEILRVEFANRRNAVLSTLASIGVLIVIVRRREAIWFVIGWGIVAVTMSPGLIGMDRVGLIDESHWKYAVQTAFAAAAGLGVGLICERVGKSRSISWNILLLTLAMAMVLWEVVRQSPLPDSCRYVLPEDVRVMAWIEQNVPSGEKIAGRALFSRGETSGLDAITWLPYFTKHQTNQTNLAAALEEGSPETRENSRNFTSELFMRDMSVPESAQWMRGHGFSWFYAGAMHPEWDPELMQQISINPGLELVKEQASARLYHVR
jgi:hypothetical protein